MKTYLLNSLFLLIFNLSYSQTTQGVKIFLDSTWSETTEANHKYYRIINDYHATKDEYRVRDYYKSGVLQMEGSSKTTDADSKEGEFVFYYESGSKKSITNYSKNRVIGKDFQWYENGTKKSEGEYFESKNGISNNYKLSQHWNAEGKQTVIDGNGYFEEIAENYSESGNIKNGLKEGVWKGDYNKKDKYIEEYKKGEIVSGVSTDDDNKEYKYDVLESRPEPKGGIQDFYQYIGKNFVIPKGYENLKGKIITTFIVDKDGTIVEPKIIKSVNEILDQEAIRVITSYEKWIPAKQRGRYVRVLYSIPLTLAGAK